MRYMYPRPLVVASLLLAAASPLDLTAQNATATVSYPRTLREAAQVAERLEKFIAGEGNFDWPKIPSALESATAQVDAYLADAPDDVSAIILKVRLGHLAAMMRGTVISSDGAGQLVMDTVDYGAPLHALLDRAVALEPRLAEGYYWKARLYATPRLRMERGTPTMRADWHRTVEAAGTAVDLAPAETRYRELLALGLAQVGEVDRAREVLRDVQKGKHVLYLILEDFARFPIPETAVPWPRMADVTAEMFGGAVGALRRFSPQRVRSFVVPGSTEALEAFFQTHWPNFRLFQEEGGEHDLHGQFVEPKGNDFAPARSADELRRKNQPDKGIMLIVRGRAGLSKEERPHYPEGFAPAGEFCELTLVNYRQK